MNNRRRAWCLLLASMIFFGVGLFAATQKSPQQAEVLFESAKQKELVDGKLQDAIQIYQRIIQEYPANRPLAAKALLRIGQCYERLGQADARKAYERLVRDYADQQETATEARARLAALAQSSATRKSELTVRRVGTGRDVDSTGSPSSDGRFLAGTDWSTGDIVIRDVLTGDKRQVTKTGDIMKMGFGLNAKFSPDDKQIAYAWFNPKTDQFDLWLIGADGSGARLLYRDEKARAILPACWTPDGKSIVAVVHGQSGSQIVLVSAETGTIRELRPPSQSDPRSISASPDGRFLVYEIAQLDGRGDIFVMSLQGARETRLVAHPADDTGPIWTPDGQRVLFVSDRTGSPGLWLVEITDGRAVTPPELVKSDTGRIEAMGFSRNGALYHGLSTGVSEVLIATCDLKAGRLLDRPSPVSQRTVAARTRASWSPDGKLLAYLSHWDPAPQGTTITIRAADSGEERDIHVDADPVRQLGWFPDGTALVITGLNAERKPGVFRLDLTSETVSTLVQPEGLPIAQAGVAQHGRSLVYYGYKKDASLLVVRDLQTGEEKALMQGAPRPTGMAVSPDGERLAVTTADESTGRTSVLVLPVRGGEPREIYRLDQAPSISGFPGFPVWTPDGTYVLCATKLKDKTDYVLLPAAGGEPVKLASPSSGITDVSFHPDGKRVAVAAGQTRSEVWVLENFLPPLKR